MTKTSIMILSAFIFSLLSIMSLAHAGDAKKISIDEICESNMDEPMTGDDLYKDKLVQTTLETNMTRKIHSLCSDAPEGTFTVEFVTKSQRVVQCFCNAPDQKGILDTTKGSTVNIEGTFKSMTASFFESESKQCTITIQECTFN
ncbi:MAG: hypothetical protein AAF462_05275 [Thermodesulfobacteriota bacterium]